MDLFFLTSSVFSSQGGARRGPGRASLPLSPVRALGGLVVCPGEIA